MVCVQKANGGIRISEDYKQVNERILADDYKLPNIQDLLAKLTQGNEPKIFSCLDLSGAFNQLLLDEEAANVLALNTHRGLLAAKRLTYGVKIAPAQFQAAMDKILEEFPWHGELLQGDARFKCKSDQQRALEFAKEAVSNAKVVGRYDPDKDVTL